MQPPRDRLTAKERVVAILVWEGLTNREIADRIHTSEQVVKNHLRSAFDKLGVWSRLELALYVASHGGAQWEASGLAGETPVLGPAPGGAADGDAGAQVRAGVGLGNGNSALSVVRDEAHRPAERALQREGKGLAQVVGGIPA